MRIISGIYKGKRLIAPKKLPVRPTTDFGKEALFNILNNIFYFDSIQVLDLFAGTGNISYEFASRGTKNIDAVDAHYECVKYIHRTSKELNFNINSLKSDVFKFLSKIGSSYDFIFADPPYNFEDSKYTNLIDIIYQRSLLNEDGLLVIEHSNHIKLDDHPNFSYKKKYGGNIFSFFENEISSEEE